MAATKYSYSISNDFPDSLVNPDKLKSEIVASSISIALDYIETNGDVCDIWFKDSLPPADKSTLDNNTTSPAGGLIAAHDNTPNEKETSPVLIEEEHVKTGGHYQAKGWKDNIPASVGWHEFPDISFPYGVNILSAEAYCSPENDGDHFEFQIAPDTIVGNITVDVSASDTIFIVSDSVIENVYVGVHVKLDDGTNIDDCGEIIAIDKNNNQITVETAAVNSFTAATPTNVKMTIFQAKNIHLKNGHRIILGESKIGASYVPANTVMRFRYYNSEAAAKSFDFFFELLY